MGEKVEFIDMLLRNLSTISCLVGLGSRLKCNVNAEIEKRSKYSKKIKILCTFITIASCKKIRKARKVLKCPLQADTVEGLREDEALSQTQLKQVTGMFCGA